MIATRPLPTRPGIDQVPWHCKHCKNLIGIVSGGYVFTRWRGREVCAPLPVRVQCECCGHKTEREV